jgi:hypothetical protein
LLLLTNNGFIKRDTLELLHDGTSMGYLRGAASARIVKKRITVSEDFFLVARHTAI